MTKKDNARKKRIRRVRAKIQGAKDMPRLCVFKSLRYMYAQIVDDENGKILVSVDSRKLSAQGRSQPKADQPLAGAKKSGGKVKNDIETAAHVGEEIAKLAIAKKISKVVFDKRSYKYHGKVKSLAEGARKGGLKF
ncbi:MAG: 50S ribosomal protein L18 [Candidatus Moraniibacteriota bacterium]